MGYWKKIKTDKTFAAQHRANIHGGARLARQIGDQKRERPDYSSYSDYFGQYKFYEYRGDINGSIY